MMSLHSARARPAAHGSTGHAVSTPDREITHGGCCWCCTLGRACGVRRQHTPHTLAYTRTARATSVSKSSTESPMPGRAIMSRRSPPHSHAHMASRCSLSHALNHAGAPPPPSYYLHLRAPSFTTAAHAHTHRAPPPLATTLAPPRP